MNTSNKQIGMWELLHKSIRDIENGEHENLVFLWLRRVADKVDCTAVFAFQKVIKVRFILP